MDAALTPTSKAAARGRWAVSAMFLANGFIMGSWAPQIPFMLPRHGISEGVLGIMILMIGLGAVNAMAWSGWLLTHYGSRRLVSLFGVISSFMLAVVVFAPNIWLAAPALFMLGTTTGAMDVAMNANAVEVEKRLGRAIMSASHGFWSLGGFIGGLAGGPLIGRLGAENHALLACAVTLVIVLAAIPNLVAEPVHHDETGAKPKYAWPKAPIFYILGLMALFSMVPEGAVLDWAALYLSKQMGATIAVSGLAFAFFAGSMAVMRFAGDALRDRFGAVRTLRISAFTAAAGLFGASVAPNEWIAIACFALAGLGIANSVPIAFSAAGNQPGMVAGAGLAVVNLMGYSGILLAPSVIGFAAEHVGYRITYLVLAACLVGVGLAAYQAAAAERAKSVSAA